MDRGLKRWNNAHGWTERPLVQVRPAAYLVQLARPLLAACGGGGAYADVLVAAVQVALAVNAAEVTSLLLERMAA